MAQKLTFQYDRDADMLYINTVEPYASQVSDELGDDIVARLNPDTGEVENLEILSFSTRPLRQDMFALPLIADLKQAEPA